jgi:uncharacterized SAM-binding protein YcdF (DUF218 family)
VRTARRVYRFQVISIFKAIGGPGSIGFLAVCCALGLGLRAAGASRLGRAWLLAVYILYVIAGMPIVANAIAGITSPYHRLPELTDVRSADLVIVLHGDNVMGRIRETKRVVDAVSGSVSVLVCGDRDFADAVVRGGVASDRILLDSPASNTFEQIVNVSRFVREHNVRHPVLIASRVQMPRIAALLRAARMNASLVPAAIDVEPPTSGIRAFVPVYTGLRVTRDSIYELFALQYYANRGHIARMESNGPE